MIQEIIIVLLFGAALFYLGRMTWKHFSLKEGCVKGCGCEVKTKLQQLKK